MLNRFLHSFMIMCIVITAMVSCTKDPDPVNEEELITTVKYTLTSDNGDVVVMEFSDKDGSGGQSPVIKTTGTLKSSLVYQGSLLISNESVNPSQDITAEILAEAADHQFFFEPSAELTQKIKISYADTDGNGFPLGLKTKVEPLSSGAGKLRITLRHEPDKKAEGVSQGKILNAGGETDLQVEFDLEIQN